MSSMMVLFIGLPGSGKSALVDALIQEKNKSGNSSNKNFIHICFDRLLPLVDMKRSQILDYFEANYLSTCKNKKETETVYLLDDTFHLRSMRSDCFKLSHRHSLRFAQVFVHSDVDSCIRRNAQRGGCSAELPQLQITAEMITKMATAFDQPDEKSHRFESYSLILDNNNRNNNVETVDKFIMHVLDQPMIPVHTYVPSSNNEDTSGENEIHQLDLKSRQLLSLYLASVADKETKQKVAKELNDARRRLMENRNDDFASAFDKIFEKHGLKYVF